MNHATKNGKFNEDETLCDGVPNKEDLEGSSEIMNHQKCWQLIGDDLGEYGSYYSYENNNEDLYGRGKFVSNYEDNGTRTRSFNDNSALIQSEVCSTYSDENTGDVYKDDGHYKYSDNIYSYNIDNNNSFNTENNALSEESMYRRKSGRNNKDDDSKNKIGCDNYETGSQIYDEMHGLEDQHIYGNEILHDNEIRYSLRKYCGYFSYSDADKDSAHEIYEDYEQRQDDLYPVDERIDGDWNESLDNTSTWSELSTTSFNNCSSVHYRQARSIPLKKTRSSERNCQFEKPKIYREEDNYYSISDNNNSQVDLYPVDERIDGNWNDARDEVSKADSQHTFDDSNNGSHYQNNLPVPYSNAIFYQPEENSKMANCNSIRPPEEYQKRDFYNLEYCSLPDHQNSFTYSNSDDVDFQNTACIHNNSCKNCYSFPDQQVENIRCHYFHTNPHNNQSCKASSNIDLHWKELNSGIEYNYIVSQCGKYQNHINIDESEELNEYECVSEPDNQMVSSEGRSCQQRYKFNYGSHQGDSRTLSGCIMDQKKNEYELPYETLNHCWSDYQALHYLSGIKKDKINRKQQQSSSHLKFHLKSEETSGHNISLNHKFYIDSYHTLKSSHESHSNYNYEDGTEYDPSYNFYSLKAKFSDLNTTSCYGDPQKRYRGKRTPYIVEKNAADKEIECDTNHSQTYGGPCEYESYCLNYSRDFRSESQKDYVPDHEYSKKEWLGCCKRSSSRETTTNSYHYDCNGNVSLTDEVESYNLTKCKRPSRNTYLKDPFRKVKTLKKKGNSHLPVMNEIVSVAENDNALYLTDRNCKIYNTGCGWLQDRCDDKSNFSQNSLAQKSLIKTTKWQSLTDTEETQMKYHKKMNSKKCQRIQKNNNIRKGQGKIKKKSAAKNRFPKRSTKNSGNMNLAIKNRTEKANLITADMLIFCQKDNAKQFSTHDNVNDNFSSETFHGFKSQQKLNKKRIERKPLKSTVCERNSVVMDIIGAKSKARLSKKVKGFSLTKKENEENNNCEQQEKFVSLTKKRKIKKKNSKDKSQKRKKLLLREAFKSDVFFKDIKLRKTEKKVLHISKDPGEKIKNEILEKLYEFKSKRQEKLSANLNHMFMFSSAIGKFQRNQQEFSQKCKSLLQDQQQSFYSQNVTLNKQNKAIHDKMNLANLKNINKNTSLKELQETLKMARLSLALGNEVLNEIESSKLKDKTATCERFQTVINKALISNFMKASQKQKFISTATQTDDINFVVLEDAEIEDWPPLPDLIDEFKHPELLYNDTDILPPPPPTKHIIVSKTTDGEQEWPPLPSFVEVLELEKTVSFNKSFPTTHIYSVVNKEKKLTEQINDTSNVEISSMIHNKHVISRLLYPAEYELVLLEIGEEVTVSFAFDHIRNEFQYYI